MVVEHASIYEESSIMIRREGQGILPTIVCHTLNPPALPPGRRDNSALTVLISVDRKSAFHPKYTVTWWLYYGI